MTAVAARTSLTLAAALLALAIAPLGAAEPPYGPHPIPAGSAWISSYDDAIAELGRLSGRTPIPSPMLAEWMKNHALNGGGGFAWPVRDYDSPEEKRDGFRAFTGLVARDGDGETVQIDFDWHRPGTVAPIELMAFLTSHSAPQPTDSSTEETYDNPWEKNFDALLSAPENFSRVWRLRATADSRLWALLRHHPDTLYAGAIRDEKGAVHRLFLTEQSNAWEGSACAYLFDAKGRFESGTLLDTGHRIHSFSAYVDPSGTELTLDGWFNYSQMEFYQAYRLKDGQLVLQQVHDGDGTPLSPESVASGYHCGDILYAAPREK